MKIFFTIPDRTFSYDCSKCGSFCCLGQGFGLNLADPHESQLLEREPFLKYFARTNSDEHYFEIDGYTDKCFFLNEQGLCSVQKEHGYSAKPFVCKFFPMNLFTLAGDLLIVDLHTICPVNMRGEGRLIDLAALKEEIFKLDERFLKRFEIKDKQKAREIYKAIEAPGFKPQQEHLDTLKDFLEFPGQIEDNALFEMFQALEISFRVKLFLKEVDFRIAGRFLQGLFLFAHLLQKANGGALGVRSVFDLYAKRWGMFYLLSFLNEIPYFKNPQKLDHQKLPTASSDPLDKLFSTYVYQQTLGRFAPSTLLELVNQKLKISSLQEKLFFLQRSGNLIKKLTFKDKKDLI